MTSQLGVLRLTEVSAGNHARDISAVIVAQAILIEVLGSTPFCIVTRQCRRTMVGFNAPSVPVPVKDLAASGDFST
jgi:hypothetical protein